MRKGIWFSKYMSLLHSSDLSVQIITGPWNFCQARRMKVKVALNKNYFWIINVQCSFHTETFLLFCSTTKLTAFSIKIALSVNALKKLISWKYGYRNIFCSQVVQEIKHYSFFIYKTQFQISIQEQSTQRKIALSSSYTLFIPSASCNMFKSRQFLCKLCRIKIIFLIKNDVTI